MTDMYNVKWEITNDVITIQVDLKQAPFTSKSGKSNVIGSTKGNQRIRYKDGFIFIGLNLYEKIDAPKK